MDYEKLLKEQRIFDEWEYERKETDQVDSAIELSSVECMVNHPKHYNSGRVEVIDIIEDAVRDAPNVVLGGLQWNVLKYVLRMWLKDNPKQDAEKAEWYLSRLIDKLCI